MTLAQPADLSALTWPEFEEFTGRTFALQGYTVELTPEGADGGVDVNLTWGDQRFLVQCKHWTRVKVGVAIVRSLYGVMAAQRATGGFVVASGGFTPDAKQFAADVGIHLVDGEALLRFSSEHPELAELLAQKAAERTAGVATHGTPWCPWCGGPMVVRTSSKGKTAGNSFWGCPRYPLCKGKRDLDGPAPEGATAAPAAAAKPLTLSRAERNALRRRERRQEAIVRAIASVIGMVILYLVFVYVILPGWLKRP